MRSDIREAMVHIGVAISIVLGLAIATHGCGVQLGTENNVLDPNDPLRARVEAECGPDALVLKAVDQSVEAVCCVTYMGIIPHLNCLTGNGKSVANPTQSKLRKVAAE